MKYFIITFIVLLLVASGSTSKLYAATSATPSPTAAILQKKIDDIKERLATKAAELTHFELRVSEGTIKTVSVASITVETSTKELKLELPDEVKVVQYLKGKRTMLTTEDLSKNDYVVIFGEYDTTLDVLKPSVVFIQGSRPVRITGEITNVNAKTYTLTVQALDGTEYTLDYETSTKTSQWTQNGKELTKIGFSKLIKGSVITATGFSDARMINK